MKIKVESEKIIKAVKRLDGIEIVVENTDDAKEAFDLIFKKTGVFEGDDARKLKGFQVSAFKQYETSAVDYKMIFVLEFQFDADASLDSKVAIIKKLQEFFNKI